MEFAPAIYEHAAACINTTPWEASRGADLLFRAHAEAHRLYGHRSIVPGIDIYNVEAEAYGARIEAPEGSVIPSIVQYPCDSVREIIDLHHPDPAQAGRLPMILDTACRLKEEFPNAEIRVPLSGPFSLASGLLGFDTLLCEVMTDPEASLKSFFHLTDGQLAVCEAVARAGLRVTFFESGAAPPLLSPGLFRDLVLPPVKRLVESGTEMFDDPPAFIIGGNTVPILDAILATGTRDLICPAETDQAAFMEKIAARPDVTVRINIDPGLFATGSWERVAPELERAAALARLKPGTQIGSGVLPYETDTHIVLKARDFVASL